MLNALLTSATENLSVLVVLLVWFIWQQSTRHKDMTSLRKDIADGDAALRKEITDSNAALRKEIANVEATLRKQIANVETTLRKDIAMQGERIAKIEGLLMGLAPYDTVAEPPPVGYEIEDKDGNGDENGSKDK